MWTEYSKLWRASEPDCDWLNLYKSGTKQTWAEFKHVAYTGHHTVSLLLRLNLKLIVVNGKIPKTFRVLIQEHNYSINLNLLYPKHARLAVTLGFFFMCSHPNSQLNTLEKFNNIEHGWLYLFAPISAAVQRYLILLFVHRQNDLILLPVCSFLPWYQRFMLVCLLGILFV